MEEATEVCWYCKGEPRFSATSFCGVCYGTGYAPRSTRMRAEFNDGPLVVSGPCPSCESLRAELESLRGKLRELDAKITAMRQRAKTDLETFDQPTMHDRGMWLGIEAAAKSTGCWLRELGLVEAITGRNGDAEGIRSDEGSVDSERGSGEAGEGRGGSEVHQAAPRAGGKRVARKEGDQEGGSPEEVTIDLSGGLWTPVRDGKRYCSPACGGGCTWAAYREAVRLADDLAYNQCGKGFVPVVWENLGWHYKAVNEKRRIEVYPDGRDGYQASIGGGQFVAKGDSPAEAIDWASRQVADKITELKKLVRAFNGS